MVSQVSEGLTSVSLFVIFIPLFLWILDRFQDPLFNEFLFFHSRNGFPAVVFKHFIVSQIEGMCSLTVL